MARSFTTNLKLILEDTLSSVSKYNLERLDSLGEVFTITEARTLDIRGEDKIILRPAAQEAGGTGQGGQLDVGTTTQFLDNIFLYSDEVSVFGDLSVSSVLKLKNGSNYLSLQAPTLSSSLSFTLPNSDGSSGQVLGTNGAGVLDWTSPTGRDAGTFTWSQADGTTKSIAHNFNTNTIQVTVYDNTDGSQVFIEEINELSANLVELVALEAPPTSGYTVYIIEV